MDSLTRHTFIQHGLRCTRQRMAIYHALASCTSHPTADELHHMVCDGENRLSLATVYNTLEAFTKAGLCRKLPTTSGSIRYDADMTDHLHVRMKDSGRLVDVPTNLGDKLLRGLPRAAISEIEKAMGVRIDGFQMQLIGQSNVRDNLD